ncbi:hydantoinase/oxoprolinase family protein [Patulibacter defluvii]|uniref:hydantoinase/oxoprolinase family protein n=1 Tax=Patulibacter defluvii TaxID=3095358 RepID=UPI002A74B11B|nr:hydantoinase/oxoprolinase family protein [Patulibacter sp. DM4]
MSYAIGIDVGGTFTDFVVVDERDRSYWAHKSPSTPADPSEGLLRGLGEIAEGLGLAPAAFLARISLIVHGTTVTTNAVLTGRGARTGLLTTEGFRDVLQMRRGVRSREHLYDNTYVAPPPLVPRERRLPVPERIDAAGEVRRPLDREALATAVRQLVDDDVEALAVCFMHAYADDRHEREARAVIEELAPELFLSVSSEVLPQIRLNDRVSTTVMNAYVGPVLRRYVERLVGRLAADGFPGVLLVMQSNGGVATPAVVSRLPATTVLSGPAGGPVAALAHARQRGDADCILVDMGGTSYDASIVRDGAVQTTREGQIDRHPISLPMTDVHTIGAGGGSIGWLDEGGLLHMGPQSAGAHPGPAAYDRGGTLPTCADADLLLGYLDPAYFLGGRMPLREDLARAAIERHVAGPLGLDPVAAAGAMIEVITLVMAAGTKDVALGRGFDPRELLLVAAGGAGPLHAGMIAEELEMDRVVVPRMSAVMCAFGMLLADLRHDYVRSHSRPWERLDVAEARGIVDEMIAAGVAALEEEGIAPADRSWTASADLRYRGQHHEVTVTFPPEDLADERLTRIEEAFHRRHEELYGFSSRGRPMEVVTLRATVRGRRPPLDLTVPAAGEDPPPRRGRRRAYLPSTRSMEEIEVIDGDALRPGHRLVGPAIVEGSTTSIFVPEAFDVLVDATGSIVMHRKGVEA